MPDPRSAPDDRPNIGSEPLEDELRAIEGEEPVEDQDAVVDAVEIEDDDEPTMTELDRGENDRANVGRLPGDDDLASLEVLASGELRSDETDDPDVATEEGLAWVPPSDPPVIADAEEDDGIVIASGIGTSALDEPYDDDHRSEDLTAEGDMNARIREAIRADAATSGYADRILIAVLGSTVILRGVVDDLADGDELVAVVERVKGVDEVRDETDVASLG
ncbi:MAG TPA: BON domain-containing protein [Candidatus Bathyarchaeia archaeon]|nr:BON domain-containing protein [Candidatus Bathyarchaeia archaeon]